MKRLLFFIPLILFGIAIGFFFLQLKDIESGKDISALDSALIGRPMPGFSLSSLKDEGELLTNSELPKAPFLLNIWATWCPSCRQEHPYLVELAKSRGIPIVGLNYKDSRPAARQWLQRLGNPYIFSLFDEHGSLGFDLGVYGAPETYLVSGNGVILTRHVGTLDEDVWQQHFAPLLRN